MSASLSNGSATTVGARASATTGFSAQPTVHTRTSYKFHATLEPFSAFLRREWKPVTLFAGLFVAACLTVIFSVDPAFYYPRIQTDPLRYLLKAHAFIDTGRTAARAAVNIPPFLYAAMPGVIRAPLIMAFSDFGDQWRAIQVTNVIFVTLVALMSAYILSWSQPVKRHWMTIALAFAFSAIATWWMANVLFPLADAPYAAFSLGALILSLRILTSDKPKFLPEVLYVLAPFPILAPIAPSVARYLASYQPFFWIFFYAGASSLLLPLMPRIRQARRITTVAAIAIVLVAISLAALRLRKIAGTTNPSRAVSVMRAPAYVAGVAGPFRGLRQFIETLPAERTLLVGAGATSGRWTVISGRKYYSPDSNLVNVVRSKDVYLLSECGTLEVCRDFDAWTQHLEDDVRRRGRFDFKPVFSRQTAQAQVAVFRVTASR
ncbi:MAG TPA: hypothetical protein VFC35_06450 [Gemmatimonadaceae bacterium]|nr:hypothetical protein [Gemmatimonadaceae bacterium]